MYDTKSDAKQPELRSWAKSGSGAFLKPGVMTPIKARPVAMVSAYRPTPGETLTSPILCASDAAPASTDSKVWPELPLTIPLVPSATALQSKTMMAPMASVASNPISRHRPRIQRRLVISSNNPTPAVTTARTRSVGPRASKPLDDFGM